MLVYGWVIHDLHGIVQDRHHLRNVELIVFVGFIVVKVFLSEGIFLLSCGDMGVVIEDGFDLGLRQAHFLREALVAFDVFHETSASVVLHGMSVSTMQRERRVTSKRTLQCHSISFEAAELRISRTGNLLLSHILPVT